MPLSNLDHKKLYYYVICIMAFFVLMWGVIDLAGSSIGLLNLRPSANISSQQMESDEPIAPTEKGDQFFDVYYQKKMLGDRLWDSLARVVVSGAIFIFCRKKIDSLEV